MVLLLGSTVQHVSYTYIHSPSPILPRLHSIVSLHDRLATLHDVQPRACLAPLWCPPSLVAEEAAAGGSARVQANNTIHPRFLFALTAIGNGVQVVVNCGKDEK